MILKGQCLKAALKALDEGRLWWRVTDQYGRSCNGGDRDFRLDPATSEKPGDWAPRIEDVSICSVGYHVTCDPIRWSGLRVALVEIDKIVGRQEDKALCHTFREIGIVEPWDCCDVRLWVAASRPLLFGADLYGADLDGADLDGANLNGANLDGANLNRANLNGANLNGANLNRANLNKANLNRANLNGANLDGANLNRANLNGANLNGANLNRANLNKANLNRANLTWTEPT